MKKFLICASVILLLISTAGCGKNTQKTENIYSAIHSVYYDIGSYNALCSVTAYTQGGQNTYKCNVSYQKDKGMFTVESDDMKISIDKNKTLISKGENMLETPPGENDMYMFVNTFFKSYYESESTSMISAASKKNDTTLLECDVINPTNAAAHMKLWINSKTILPQKMQVYDKNDFMNTEIVFEKFEFAKEL